MSASRDLFEAYVTAEPVDAGMAVAALPPEDATAWLLEAEPTTAATLIQHMPGPAAARGLAGLPAEDAARVAEQIPLDELATLLRRCEPAVTAGVLDALPGDLTSALRTLLATTEGTAGAALDPRVPVVQADATAGDVRAYLKDVYTRLFDYVYVVEEDRTLIGVINLDALATADAHTPARQVTRDTVDWLRVEMPLDAVQAHPGWQRFDVLPVVDGRSRFVGVVRHRRLRQLLREGQASPRDDSGMRTLMALGEVYWLGLCGILQGLSTAASLPPERPGGSR
jgi:Mg/Co/Ni transporter MgtE